MPVIRLEVSGDLAELLAAERDLLGFETRAEYVKWIVENRAAIDDGSQRDRLLSEYAKRVQELEARVEGDADGDRPRATADGGATVDDRPKASADGGAAVDGHNLRPRAKRIANDTVAEAANELQGVQGEAFDELARRAVKQTRERLGEGTGTGLDYSSRTTLSTDGARPGSDIADLDDIEVPGYDDELIARRRIAVGAALAHLKDVGEAKRGDFVDALYEEYPAGYESTDGWWDCLKRGLRQVDRVDGAGDDSRIWRFRDYRGRVRVLSE
jgi:hypothetical protein